MTEPFNVIKEHKDPPWNIQAAPNARSILAQKCPEVLNRLKTSSIEDKLAFLTDTRNVHKELFQEFTPEGYEAYAGTYRGEPGSVLEQRRTAIFFKDIPGLKGRYPTLNPERVREYIEVLNGYIEETLLGDFDQTTYFNRCMRIYGDFNMIHPYLDGNGHIVRMMLTVLADHKGIDVSPTWKIHPRPFGYGMAICFEHYKHYPELLEQYLKIWFKI